MRAILLLLTITAITACDMRGDTPKDGVGEGGSDFSAKDFPRENGRIYGGWEGNETTAGSGIKYRLFFSRNGRVGMEMLCEHDKTTVRASASGSVRIEDRKFTIAGTLSGQTKDGAGCSFTYNPGPLMYQITSEILELGVPEQSGMRVMRRLY